MKKIYTLLTLFFLSYSSVTAQLLFSTKFESQEVGTAYTRPVWQSEGFATGSWDSNLSTRTMVDNTYSYSGEKSLRVSYPKGGYGPSQTGTQVDLKFDDRNEAYMSYWIRFSDDFSYGTTYEGGKLPGLGSGNCSGSNVSDGTNGFTARFMWRPGGQIVVLLYHMDFTESMGEDQELTYPDGSLVHIPRGEWHHIAERVKTNTVTNGTANPDGELEVWFDGQQVLLRTGLRFRTNTDGINELYFSTFHGGGSVDWAPTVDSYIWFDDIRVGTTYESVQMQSCTNPNIGGDKALCGSSVSLEAQCKESLAQYLTWYRDGEKIAEKSKNITATQTGTYTASYDSAWCAEKSSAMVQNSLQLNLGEDQYICASSFVTLASNVEGDSYSWQKDGKDLSETNASIQVKDAGTYKLTVNKTGCSSASDEIIVTSGLLPIEDKTGTTGESVTLQSANGETINWYNNPDASPISKGITYTTTFPESEKYIYATDADAFVGNVGKEAAVSGLTYHHGASDFVKERLQFTTYKSLTIDEVTVFAFNTQNVTIRILDASASNVLFTKTFENVTAGGVTLKLNATLDAGTYQMDAVGTTGELLYSNNKDVISFPYTIENVISITNSIFNNNKNTNNYAYFYNFKVHSGNTCAATPVKLTGSGNGGGGEITVLPDPDVTVSIDANSGNRIISPYLYAFNGYGKNVKYDSEDFASRVYEAGIHMTRQNSGNNCTKYNWRKKLTSHPNWYNNVHDEDWDAIALSMQENFPDVQCMFGFQLLGRVASSKDYNFPDWEYNKAVRWEGCEKNYAGNGSTKDNFNFTEGDVTLYTQEWTPDSTAAIVTHWQDDLGLNMNQFLYWNMDNEVEIWGSTHDDVIKEVTNDVFEMYIQNYVATVKAVRKLNPNIKICGPVAAAEWDWYNPTTMQPTYNGKKYCWLEYVILRLAEEEKKCGVKMIDVFDIHNYPIDTDVPTMLQTHRLYWDEDYDYPGANGVKKINGYWDNSITKEMIFVRCQNWIDKYFGKGYEVTYGISEYNIKSTDAMPTALAYAGNLGEGARHGMEYFMPWDWRTGMWETAHLFSRYAKNINVNAVSSNEEMISAYTSINGSRDSMTVILVNRNGNGQQIVQAELTNFDCPSGSYDAYILANLPNGEETFVSHNENALEKTTATVLDGKVSITIPAYSITAVVLDLQDSGEKYAVTFVVDGETISSQRVEKGKNAVAPANPTLTGHTFIQWDKAFTNITENTTVTAIFEPIKYTVSFYDMDNSLIDEQTVSYGEDAVEPEIRAHEGYLFAKWDKEFTNVTADISVKAEYVERPNSNRYEAENARVTNETVNIRESDMASNGQYLDVRSADIAFDIVVEKAGEYRINIVYSLSDRTQSGDGSKYQKFYVNRTEPYTYMEFPKTGANDPTFATIVDTITLNRGLNVIEFLKSWGWIDMDYIEIIPLEVVTHTVSFVDWNGSSLGEPQLVNDGEAAVAPEAPTRTGYTFAGWDKSFSSVVEDMTIQATYSILSYFVTFVDYDGKELKTETVEYGGSATAPNNPTRNGYTFSGWIGTFTNVTDNVTITASYTELGKASYTELDNAIASTLNLNESQYTVESWSNLQTALAEARSIDRNLFEENQSIVNAAAETLNNAIENLVIQSFTVTFVADGKTISTQTIAYGNSAEAPTNPTKIGYTFDEWDTDFSNITGKTTVTAVFHINTYTVSFVDYDGKKLKTEMVEYGANATAPENPTRDGYTFSGWIGAFTNVTDDVTITASYTELGKASYEALNKAIADAEALTEMEYDESSWSSVQIALTNARNIDKNLSVESQSIVDEATTNLQNAIIELKKLDKSQLEETIATARTTLAESEGNVGEGIGQYPQSAVEKFENAIQTAVSVFENARNQGNIDQEIETLKQQIQDFLASVNKHIVSIDDLYELLAEAKELLDNSSVGENSGQYPLIEYMNLNNAYTAAENVANQQTPSENNVYTQVVRLENAIESFKNSYILTIDDLSETIKVYATNNIIYVIQSENNEITVYNSNGEIVTHIARTQMNSMAQIPVSTKGLYFVVVGNKTFKTIVR